MSELENDARIIDAVFKQYGIGARVARVPYSSFQSAGWNVFALQRQHGVKVRDVVKIADELDEALTDMRAQAIQCRFDTLPLRVMTPRRKPETADVLDVLANVAPKVRGRGRLLMLLGEVIKANGVRQSVVDLAESTTPHVLVAGTTGSGKTTALVDMVLSLSRLNDARRLSIRVLDPKMTDLHILDGLPGMAYSVVRDPETCIDALRATVADMDERKRRGMVEPDERIILVLDEIAELVAVAGDDVNALLARLLQAGRGLGVHVIGATQKPAVAVLGSLSKSNFPVRLVGRVMNKTDANTAAGIADTGAERLPGKGAFVKVSAAGVELLQVPNMDRRRVAQLGGTSVRQYAPRQDSRKQPENVTFDAVPQYVPANLPTAVQAVPAQGFDLYRTPTRAEAHAIRHLYRELGSKNAVIRHFWPNTNKNRCLAFVDAALSRQEVNT